MPLRMIRYLLVLSLFLNAALVYGLARERADYDAAALRYMRHIGSLYAPVTPPPVAKVPAVFATPVYAPVRAQQIVVTRLGISLPLVEGGDENTVPDGVALHWPGTAWPCEPGHAYVYAHARQGVFLALWNAVIGDIVDFGVCRYRVDTIRRVPATDVSVFTGDGLTLQTSTGPSTQYPELLVHAVIDYVGKEVTE